MKAIGIEHIDSFPFPTVPPFKSIRSAMRLLTNIGALKSTILSTRHSNNNNDFEKLNNLLIQKEIIQNNSSNTSSSSSILSNMITRMRREEQGDVSVGLTELGCSMARFPINPRFAKMIIMAYQHDYKIEKADDMILSYMLSFVAALSERSVFVANEDIIQKQLVDDEVDEDDQQHKHNNSNNNDKKLSKDVTLFHHKDGDSLARLRATGAYMYSCFQSSTSGDPTLSSQLCDSQNLHEQTLKRIVDLRKQLQHLCSTILPPVELIDKQSDENNPDVISGSGSWKILLNPPLEPPANTHEILLRQLLASGFNDCIAKKVPYGVVKD
eukprot:gene7285-9927_t